MVLYSWTSSWWPSRRPAAARSPAGQLAALAAPHAPEPLCSRSAVGLEAVNFNWCAANGGVTNGGLRGVWPPVLEIGQNRPFSPVFCLFRPFPEGPESTWKIQKTEEKGLFPQISSDLLKPPSLKPPFAAPQFEQRSEAFAHQEFPKAPAVGN